MPIVGINAVSPRGQPVEQREPSDFEKLMQGLQVAQSAFNIYADIRKLGQEKQRLEMQQRQGDLDIRMKEQQLAAYPQQQALAQETQRANLDLTKAQTSKTQTETRLLEQQKPDKGAPKEVKELWNDYSNHPVSKKTDAMQSNYLQMKKISKDTSPISDLTMLVKYFKIIDPTSTVKEGEVATAENARGIDETLRNIYNRTVSGVKLTDTQRENILGQARMLYEAQLESQRNIDERFRRFAYRYDVDFMPGNWTTPDIDENKQMSDPESIIQKANEIGFDNLNDDELRLLENALDAKRVPNRLQ